MPSKRSVCFRISVFVFGIFTDAALAWALSVRFGVSWIWCFAGVTSLILLGIGVLEEIREFRGKAKASTLSPSREELVESLTKLDDPKLRPFGMDIPMPPELSRSAKDWIRAEINFRDVKQGHENLMSREAVEEGLRYASRIGQAVKFLDSLDRIAGHVKLHGDDADPIRDDIAYVAKILARARLERPIT